ncbi:hypothetical protein NM688_g2355 [Phlebia brevispora]|uniref:Uncharacterized protein n=1 Tax=Phlebia brevispora TaxID=194682 RepID=A0ACC1T8Y6_9APHY|nr:hypothetical protein NM688_g2355 [Phlebia brevispora]
MSIREHLWQDLQDMVPHHLRGQVDPAGGVTPRLRPHRLRRALTHPIWALLSRRRQSQGSANNPMNLARRMRIYCRSRRPLDSHRQSVAPYTHTHPPIYVFPPMNHSPIPLMQAPPLGVQALRSPPQSMPLPDMPRLAQPIGIALPPMQPGAIQPLRTPPMPTARTNQGLSPSLAMMLSPPVPNDGSPSRQAPPYPPRINIGLPPHPTQPGPSPRLPEDPHLMNRKHIDRFAMGPQSPTVPRR